MRTALLLLFLAACGGDRNRPAPGPGAPAESAPAPETGGERMGDQHPTGGDPTTAPGPDGGPNANDFDVCVKECVRSRQMQAIPMEKIEADCQGECASK